MSSQTKTNEYETANACEPLSYEAFEVMGREDLEAHPEARSTPEVFTLARIAEFCEARNTGRRVEVSEDLFEYFLGVLPPIHMGYIAEVLARPGEWTRVYAGFGFAEGRELVTAFYCGSGSERGRYFAQLTRERNRG